MTRAVLLVATACLALSCSPHAEVTAPPPTPLDVAALWDFRDPELSEARFRAALELLYRALGDHERARHYAERAMALSSER